MNENIKIDPRPTSITRVYHMQYKNLPVWIHVTDDRPGNDPDSRYNPGDVSIVCNGTLSLAEYRDLLRWLTEKVAFAEPDTIAMMDAHSWRRD